jgi:hypothetical protein
LSFEPAAGMVDHLADDADVPSELIVRREVVRRTHTMRSGMATIVALDWLRVDPIVVAHVIPLGCAHVIPQGVGPLVMFYWVAWGVVESSRPGRLFGR